MTRKRIYVAGAYSADNVMQVFKNMSHGIEISTQLLKLGFAPFCPWLDFQFAINDPNLTIDDFYEYSLAWMEAADFLYVLVGWENSKGTINEIARAKELQIPVLYEKEFSPMELSRAIIPEEV